MVGLYKPWIVLWWMPKQNRKLVLQIYGTLGAVLAFAFFLAGFLRQIFHPRHEHCKVPLSTRMCYHPGVSANQYVNPSTVCINGTKDILGFMVNKVH